MTLPEIIKEFIKDGHVAYEKEGILYVDDVPFATIIIIDKEH
jgi:hypothetical protein